MNKILNLIFQVLIAQGIFLILNSHIFSFLKKIKNQTFQYFLKCSVCQGFWIGLFLSFYIPVLFPPLDGIMTSCGSYLLHCLFSYLKNEIILDNNEKEK